MPSVAIVFGSSANALQELIDARALAPDAPIICVNDALRVHANAFRDERAAAFVTLHPEKAKRFLAGLDVEGLPLFTMQAQAYSPIPWRVVRERWGGTSGLFAAQVALEELGFAGVILAGCPMESAAGTSYRLEKGRTQWANGSELRYQRNWTKALPAIGRRVRSMAGWTQRLLGAPDSEWLQSLERVSLEIPETPTPEAGKGAPRAARARDARAKVAPEAEAPGPHYQPAASRYAARAQRIAERLEKRTARIRALSQLE